jgi:proline dehydrogenase
VDDNFHWMAEQLWKPGARGNGAWATMGTHDRHLIGELELLGKRMDVGAKDYEYALLYGIQRNEQLQSGEGRSQRARAHQLRRHWFPWYMRRLAERPANLLFVARSMFAS